MDRGSLINISKFFAMVGMIVDIFFLIPFITGLIYNENISFLGLFILFSFLFFSAILISLKDYNFQMRIKEAILSVNIVWLLLGTMGSIPLINATHITFIDGFFESISGFTTTGATIYSDISDLPHFVLMLRSTMHWIGGMGVIVLGVGLLSLINPTGSLALFKSESTGIKAEKITPKLKDTAIKLWEVYFFITMIDMLLLKLGGMNFFDAINHAFATISTGGFSTKTASMGYWDHNPFIIWTTTIFMFISGINFIAHIRLLKGNFQGYNTEETRWYLYIFLTLSLCLTFVHYTGSHDSLFYSMTHAFFTISSIITTTGFATVNYALWGHAAIAIIFLAMLIGANTGSTAGGIKIIRFVIMFKNLSAQLKKTLHPQAIVSVKVDKQIIPNSIINQVSGFIFLYILVLSLITLYLFASGYDFMTSITATIACVGNIGPGFGHVGPADNFAFFTQTQKFILSIGMIIGRLECYTVLILLSKNFWKKF
jgi:trk system potassium uptake protein TrkH